MSETTEICLYPPCKNQPKDRGLCKTHLPAASKLVRDKKTTWGKLLDAGRVKLPTPQMGPVATWFMSGEGIKKD